MKKDKYEVNGISLENVRNSYELRIINTINNLLPEYADFDYCPICIQDVYALSLNQLSPKYVQEGTIVLKKEYKDNDFRDVVEFAIEKVIRHPNHSE